MVNQSNESAESIEVYDSDDESIKSLESDSDDESLKSLESYHEQDSLVSSVNELQVDADSNKFKILQNNRSSYCMALDNRYQKMEPSTKEITTEKVVLTPV